MTLKEKLQLTKIEFLLEISTKKGNVLPFDDNLYDKLRNYYHGDSSFHWWVEADGWCYDPTSLYKFKKEDYYKIFKPMH